MISTDPVAKWEVEELLRKTETNIIKSLLLCVKERGYCRYKTNLEYRDDY